MTSGFIDIAIGTLLARVRNNQYTYLRKVVTVKSNLKVTGKLDNFLLNVA